MKAVVLKENNALSRTTRSSASRSCSSHRAGARIRDTRDTDLSETGERV